MFNDDTPLSVYPSRQKIRNLLTRLDQDLTYLMAIDQNEGFWDDANVVLQELIDTLDKAGII